jgi:hypothetical protein
MLYQQLALPSINCCCGTAINAHSPWSDTTTTTQTLRQSLVPSATPSIPHAQPRPIPQILAILDNAPQSSGSRSGQRRVSEAREQFHGRTPISARAHAPQPSIGLPATTSRTGPRLGYPSAPTSHNVAGIASTSGVDTPVTSQGMSTKTIFAFLPLQVRLNSQIRTRF